MTREEALEWFKDRKKRYCLDDKCQQAEDMAIKALEQEPCEDEYIKVPKKAMKYVTKGMVAYNYKWLREHFDIERLVVCGEQEPCEDAISRQAVCNIVDAIRDCISVEGYWAILERLKRLPSVNPQPKTGHCKECKYFEHNSMVKVDGIPLIVAHEICKRWGDGRKTKEDGYCFMFEPQESEG